MTTKAHQVTVLMLVATSVAGDSRVLREAQSLVKHGYRVQIIGKEIPPDYKPPKGISVFSATSGHGLRPASMSSLATKRLSPHLRLARWLLLPRHRAKSFGKWSAAAYLVAKDLDFSVVHAHDFTALALGARLAEERKVDLVYDSHEWWIGRQRQYRPTPIIDLREARQEARLARQAAAVITVGDSIAALFRDKRGCQHVSVVRNSFPYSGDTTERVTSPPTGILYAGRIDAFRELEVMVSLAEKKFISLCWMGSYDNQWASTWVPLARSKGIEVLAAQPLESVTAAMQKVGLAFVTHSDRFESYRLAMPNKLFHAMQAGVPIIATDVSELAGVVRKYDVGELYIPGDSHSMEAAIARALARHDQLITNVNVAKRELSWERDEETLLNIYRSLSSGVK